MKKYILFFSLLVLCFASCAKQNNASNAIERQVVRYPQSTLQDVYKSFYQNHFGPGHMIGDTAAVHAYQLRELGVAAADTMPNPYYEPVGSDGRFVRVYLRCVTEGLISEETLFDAFLRSVTADPDSEHSWADEWAQVEQAAVKAGVPATEEERIVLREAAQANRAVHHSEAYSKAYHPHYRIIERTIFEKEIKPSLPKFDGMAK